MRSRSTICVAALFPLLLVGCGSSNGDADPGAEVCESPIPVGSDAALLKKFPLDEWGTIVVVEERAGYVGAEAVTDTLIVELYPEIVRTLTGLGYTLLGGDNEGFEAEISFRDPKENYVNLILRRGNCEDEVRIRALIEKRGSKKS